MRGTIRIALLIVIAASVLVPGIVLAGDVRGTLQVPSDFASMTQPETDQERQRGSYWEEWNGVLDRRTPRLDVARELAVVLTGDAPLSDGEQPPLRVHNGGLSPSTMVVRAGATFQVRNDDGVAYELFAEGSTDFSAIQTAPGNARPITLAAPGNWPVRDRVQTHIRGHLHALPNLVARAFLEPNGAYTFRGVPAGSYQLQVFHGSRQVLSQDVNVPDGGTLTIPAIALSATAPAAPTTP